MAKYIHLTYQERAKIDIGLLHGLSRRQIAASIGRVASTITRELRRNGGDVAYLPFRAEERSQKKKAQHKGETKISKIPELQEYIESKLKEKWGVEVIVACWSRDYPDYSATSTEAVYQWIYSKEQQHKELCRLLRRHKRKRGMRRSRPEKESQAAKQHFTQRPAEATQRTAEGHCEADLMFSKGSQSINVMTVVDRATRMVAIVKNESKTATALEEAIAQKLPQRLPFKVKSITFDNGTEFANHQNYEADAFFCDPHSPWQKGSIEKVNEQLRAYLPFERPLASVTQEELDLIAAHLNSIPREILNFRSPLELIKQLFYQNFTGVALQS